MSGVQDAGGEGAPADEVTPVDGPGSLRRSAGDPATVLLAVERVAADVAALGRALAAQPEEVAARLDVDAATAAISVRVGALGSTLDQLRLSLLAAFDRAAERLDAPSWLPDLNAALADTRTRLEAPPWLSDLHEALHDMRLGERLDDLVATVAAADPGDRLARVEQAVSELADGVRAGAAVADALDHLGQRLVAIEDAAGRVADDGRLLVERVAPVPDRLSAIASQIDRITPLARAGDQAGSLFDRLDQVETGLEEAIALLRARGSGGAGDDDRFEGVIDVLAGVARRQDQVTASVASVVDQVRGPRNVDAVFDRMEQRERSLAARLDRIDAELRRRTDAGPRSAAEGVPRPDAETERALEAVVAVVERHERVLVQRLGQIEAALGGTGAGAGSPGQTGGALEAVLDRLQQQEAAMASHLDWVGERLAEVAAHLVPEMEDAGPRPAGYARPPTEVLERIEQREQAVTERLDRIDLDLRRLASRASAGGAPAVAGDHDDEASGSLAASVEALASITENLARLIESTAERLDRRLSRVEADVQAPTSAGTQRSRTPRSTEDAALRLARLRAERAEVQARLQEERLLADHSWEDDE